MEYEIEIHFTAKIEIEVSFSFEVETAAALGGDGTGYAWGQEDALDGFEMAPTIHFGPETQDWRDYCEGYAAGLQMLKRLGMGNGAL